MQPLCFFAVFADDYRETENGMDLFNVRTELPLIPLSPDQRGVSPHRMTLFIQIAADPGHHVLLFSHEGREYALPSEFDVPEAGAYLLRVQREFPISYTEEDSINVFPLLLDGVPLTNVYVISHPL